MQLTRNSSYVETSWKYDLIIKSPIKYIAQKIHLRKKLLHFIWYNAGILHFWCTCDIIVTRISSKNEYHAFLTKQAILKKEVFIKRKVVIHCYDLFRATHTCNGTLIWENLACTGDYLSVWFHLIPRLVGNMIFRRSLICKWRHC